MLMESCIRVYVKRRLFFSLLWTTLCVILHMIIICSSFLTVTDFQKLQEAKEVLCNEAKRKNYDLWKRSGVTIPFREWQALNDSVKTVWNVFTSHYVFSKYFIILITPCDMPCRFIYSQCIGLWEIKRNQCWKPQKQRDLSPLRQGTLILNRRHQRSCHMKPCHPQVSTFQSSLKLLKGIEIQFIWTFYTYEV